MRQLTLLGLMTLALGLAAWPAMAQPPAPGDGPGRPPVGKAFEDADKNDDGKVTLEELTAVMPNFPERAFNRLDQNDDGVLAKDEMPKPGARGPRGPQRGFRGPGPDGEGPGMRHGGPQRLFAEADANDDGKLTWEEVQAAAPDFPRERFDRMDRNDDGVLDREDRPERGPDRMGPPEGRDDAPPMGPPEGRRGEGRRGDRPRPNAGQRFADADTNEDGKLSQDEFKAGMPQAPPEAFDHLDQNDDGYLERDEMRRGPQRPGRGPEGGPARGGDRGQMARRLLAGADADENGEVTLKEIQAKRPDFPEEAFDRMDRNDDGVISRADAGGRGPERGRQPMDEQTRRQELRKRFDAADANGDGELSFEELMEGFVGQGRPPRR